MSQSQRGQGARQGSVKRARELLEAGLPPDAPDPPGTSPVRQRGREIPPQNPPPIRPRQPMPAALVASRGANGPGIGVAISRPTPVPQWPLATPLTPVTINQGELAPTRGDPPQRPPRPSASKVPSILDGSKLQEQMPPSFQYQSRSPPIEESKNELVGVMASNMKSPVTASSRPSTQSSFGSIPDFPIPTSGPPVPPAPIQARKSANLGPPSTTRRGAPSYYSNVHPIQEETSRDDPAHDSYASSAAIPSVWRDEGSDYDDDDSRREANTNSPLIEEGRDSRQSNSDDNEERNLIRNTSVGRRGKPVIKTELETDSIPPADQPSAVNEKLAKMGVYGPMEMRAAQLRAAAAARANGSAPRSHVKPDQTDNDTAWSMSGNSDSRLAGGTGFIEESSSESIVPRAMTTEDESAVHSYISAPVDPRRSRILLAHQAASGVQTEVDLEEKTPDETSRKAAPRRPPRLDLDPDRDAEMRGSLTSLPDLIRRATKLAGMIDKGKRPGSRLNQLNDFDLAEPVKEEGELNVRRNSGLSGMLAAFPPPGLATPRNNSPQLPSYFHGSSNGASTRALTAKPINKKKRRTCCGLPLWVFVVIVILTLAVIAAAVLVPLALLVFKKTQSSTSSALTQCEQTTTCANGGTNILADGTCSCICANGFTGLTCSNPSIQGCTSADIYGPNNTTYSNVTIGNAIPRLIAAAQANFSIPLSSDMILARFSASNLSCNAENSLVTFNSQDKRLEAAMFVLATIQPNPAITLVARGAHVSSTTAYVTPTATSVPTVVILDTAAPPAATGSAPNAVPTIPLASFSITPQSVDFGRVVVLYILQQQRLDTAVQAQDNLQKFFNGVLAGQTSVRDTAGNVTLGNGNVVDFLSVGIQLNGTRKIGSLPAS